MWLLARRTCENPAPVSDADDVDGDEGGRTRLEARGAQLRQLRIPAEHQDLMAR